MALTAEERTRSIEVIARVPPSMVLGVVMQQRVITEFEVLRKRFTSEAPEKVRLETAAMVVEEYEKSGRLPALCAALANRVYMDEPLQAKLLALAGSTESDAAKQRAIARRANTLPFAATYKFLGDVRAQVCVVVAVDGPTGETRLGTGFLISAAYVLTAYHTLAAHIVPGTGKARSPVAGDRLYVIFDHYEGTPITGAEANYNGPIKVGFSRDWLKCCCEDMPDDGLFLNPDANQLALLPQRLDFALIELIEPVGNQLRPGPEGLPRDWVKLKDAADTLRDDDRIIIPQHPEGHPLRLDMGRYSDVDTQFDKSLTRIRYDAEADKGSSGSPCFNQQYKLVGLHNAAFMPGGGAVIKNQAIRADRIREVIARHSPAVAELATTRPSLWSVSTDPDNPAPILGRRTLIDWIDEALIAEERAQRLYAAVTADSRSGKSFSTQILLAALRETGDSVVVLGNREQLPPTVADFMRIVGDWLRLPEKDLATFPTRPELNQPGGADGDKLRKWASEEIPTWFSTLLARNRMQAVDRRDAARVAVANLKAAGIKDLPEEAVKLAANASPVIEQVKRWERIWIVLDGLSTMPLNQEVSDVVAGLVGVNLEEPRVPEELRRVRWLFLGQVPAFVPVGDLTAEKLDATHMGAEDIIATVGEMLRTAGKKFDPVTDGTYVRTIVEPMMAAKAAGLADPMRRLETLQHIAAEVARAFAQLVGITK
jgi:hypothetical protein